MSVAEGQVNARSSIVLRTPLKSLDGALEQEFAKGEASGIELFQRLPETEAERLQTEHDQLVKEIEDDEAIEKSAEPPGGGGASGDGGSGNGDAVSDDNNPFGRGA